MKVGTRIALWLVSMLAACGGGPEYELRIGVITPDGDDTSVEFSAPDHAQAGEPFHVEITTWGSGDCTDPARVELEPLPKGVRMIPIDRHNVSDICQLSLESKRHDVKLSFDNRGTHVLELRGYKAPGADANELMRVNREITIE